MQKEYIKKNSLLLALSFMSDSQVHGPSEWKLTPEVILTHNADSNMPY